jgi:RNA polymerase sigma factor (sigma-70 family)
MASVAREPAVRARDQAFERLYQRYVADVYRYSLALLRNPTDAEDVTQTTFMNAYRAFKRGDEIQKPHNWLIKIAHNVARSRYAHASRRVQEVPLEDHIEQLAVPEDDKPNLETVLRALGRLPFNQRAALVMRELEGRTYAEIADTLGVSVSAVETLIFRARRSLRVKTSALRVLTGVPLPGSLAPLFQGGGAVAGSSAIVGAGFVGKALVALVVGAVATGLGGDRSRPVSAAEAKGGGSVASTRSDAAGLIPALPKRDRSGATHLVVRGRAGSQGAQLGDPAGAARADGAAPSSQAAGRAVPAPPVETLPQAPVQVVTNAAQSVVNTVTTAVSSATSGTLPNVPAIPPVQPPAVPQVPPVQAPQVPSVQVPPLPTVQAPSVPPVQPPALPPAPPLPRLP